MEDSIRYRVRYEDENYFNRAFKALKDNNIKAYKDFIFYYLPKMRVGEFLSEKLEDNLYRQYLQSDPLFEFVYGKFYIYYRIEDNDIILITVEPRDFLETARKSLLSTYKGCPVTSAKDRFKIDYYYATHKDTEVAKD